MIRIENRFDEYSYRVASLPLSLTVDRVEEGQWVTIKGGEVVVANEADVKAFLVIGSKREGRDQVSGKATHKVSFLVGNYMLSVSNFDGAKTYSTDMTALKVVDGGILAPVAEATDKIACYAIGQPVGGFLRIVNA
ncbi:MAG: hypothetical protein ACRCX2_34645 [Paraclostridium sp.]